MGNKNLVVLSLVLVLIALLLARGDYREVFFRQLGNSFHPSRTYLTDKIYAERLVNEKADDVACHIGYIRVAVSPEKCRGAYLDLNKRFPQSKVIQAVVAADAVCRVSSYRDDLDPDQYRPSEEELSDNQRKLRQAISAVERGMEIDRENAYYDYMNSYVLVVQKRDDEAIEAIRRGNAKTYYNSYAIQIGNASRAFASKQPLLEFFKKVRGFSWSSYPCPGSAECAKLVSKVAQVAEANGEHRRSVDLLASLFAMSRKLREDSKSLLSLYRVRRIQRIAYDHFIDRGRRVTSKRRKELELQGIAHFLSFLEKYAEKESVAMAKAELSHPYILALRREDSPFESKFSVMCANAYYLLWALIYSPVIFSSIVLATIFAFSLLFVVCLVAKRKSRAICTESTMAKNFRQLPSGLIIALFLFAVVVMCFRLGLNIGTREMLGPVEVPRSFISDDWLGVTTLGIPCIFTVLFFLLMQKFKIEIVKDGLHVTAAADKWRHAVARCVRNVPVCISILLLFYVLSIGLHCRLTSIEKTNFDLRMQNEVKALYEGKIKDDPWWDALIR